MMYGKGLRGAGVVLRIALPFGIFASTFAGAAAPASAATETRPVGGFNSVTVEGAWTVDVAIGKEPSVVLEGDPEALAQVKTSVVDGVLDIRPQHSFFSIFSDHYGKLLAHISIPSLRGFTLSGSGEAKIADLQGGDVSVVLNGSGDLAAGGRVDKLHLVINGSGGANLPDLEAESVTVAINGSGDALINARQSLDAAINGSGEIKYLGEPAHVASAVHGSGAVSRQ